ncbi:MAG TPA: PilZ domain-containing protein [bacterium]|nr:PilZ domain-containing protein [bacterium]
MNDSNRNRRSHFRFPAEVGTVAELHFTRAGQPGVVQALVLDESYSGCSLVCTGTTVLSKDQAVEVKAGKLPVMVASVCWIREIEPGLSKIGLAFKELAPGEK